VGAESADTAARDFDRAPGPGAAGGPSADAIIGWTLDGVIISWNAGAQQMYGFTAQEIVGHNVSEIIRPCRVGDLRPGLDRLAREEQLAIYETKVLRKGESDIEVSVSLSPIPDASAAVAGSPRLENLGRLPAVSAVARAEGPGAAPGARSGDRRCPATILVVDDEPAVLAVTARILRKNGYITLEAGTYEEALATASSQDFQLLLTDTMMPGMSGATLAELVTEMKPGMPVLHMSGYAADVLSPGRIHDGELAFIQKPFTAPALLDKVSAVLGVPSQA